MESVQGTTEKKCTGCGGCKCACSKKFNGPKPIEEQIGAIGTAFNLDPSHAFEFAKNLPALESFVPEEALSWVGWYAVPASGALSAKFFPDVKDPCEKHCRSIQLVNRRIHLRNKCRGQIDARHFLTHPRTAQVMDKVARRQEGDILIIAAQLGMLHSGHSAQQVRNNLAANEFGLHSVAVGSIVLTHPKRLASPSDLGMICVGEGFSWFADGQWLEVPVYDFDGGMPEFFASDCSFPPEGFGAVTAFLPQQN